MFVFLRCANTRRGMLLASVAMAWSAPVWAQDDVRVDEIVVTAQKREQSLQDVGVAVTAIGAKQLADFGRQSIDALTIKLPSTQVLSTGPNLTSFNIRGVSQNDFADTQEGPVAFYSDEVYIGAMGALAGQGFDLERVEVLRGPQGTLFGRNATGGLVQFVSAKPTSDVNGFVTLTVGDYGQVATEMALSGPLSDSVRGRVSFTTNNHRGFIENRIGKDLANSKFYGGRVQLEMNLSDRDTVRIKVQALRNDHEKGQNAALAITAPNADGLGQLVGPDENYYGTCPGCSLYNFKEPDNDPYTGSFQDEYVDFERTVLQSSLFYTRDMDFATLVSITDYQRLSKNYIEDSDMSPEDFLVYDTATRTTQLSQELRISSPSKGRLTWLMGLYGLHIKADGRYQIDLPYFESIYDYRSITKTTSLAAFANAEYALLDELKLITGLRYSWDEKKLDYRSKINGAAEPDINSQSYPDVAKTEKGNFSGKIGLEANPVSGTLLYLSVSRGIKSGGFATPIPPADPSTIGFKGEKLTSYEVGLKQRLFDGRATINLSGFYYTYDDYQAYTSLGLSQSLTNLDATIKGLEFEFNAKVARGLNIQTFGTYLDSKVKDVTLPSGEVTARRMPQAPKFSMGGSVNYSFALGDGTLGIQTDWKYNSSQYFSTFNAPIDYEKRYILGNVRASYAINDGTVEFAVFANNVTDKAYRVYAFENYLSFATQSYARPRWIGASVTMWTK
ncbi:TonB-dependent receptor [Sphingosinicella xenopeptidilytica]|uniref:TonB-dependent receptor n=1 Tax=Sphingosinicella xenopeptidilytica TaxID=364098 RepID=A0ABW3C8A5_SPHXN